jgi:hypothetical protein
MLAVTMALVSMNHVLDVPCQLHVITMLLQPSMMVPVNLILALAVRMLQHVTTMLLQRSTTAHVSSSTHVATAVGLQQQGVLIQQHVTTI